MFQELESLIWSEGSFVLSFPGWLSPLGVEKLGVVDVRVLSLELSYLLIDYFFLFSSPWDGGVKLMSWRIVNGVSCQLSEFFKFLQTWL